MKKVLSLALIAALAMSVYAEEEKSESVPKSIPREQSAIWPSPIALCQWPNSPDVIGLRLSIPFSTCQDSITGIDLGFWGESYYFEGFQFNLIRNNVRDNAAGIQVGLYNTISSGNLVGAQIGLWNETNGAEGLQVGLVNVAGSYEGFQIGLINRAETCNGFQIGVVNVIRDSELPFMPLINIGM